MGIKKTQPQIVPQHPSVPARRVRLIDLAKEMGVSVSTVSQAIRGLPSISLATRQKVQALARERNYFPDPSLSVLSSYRTRLADTRIRTSLAVISNYQPLDQWTSQAWARELYEGLAGRSSLLGYNLDYIYYGKKPADSGYLTEQLETRGIKGLLVLPNIHEPNRPEIAWRDYSSVFVFGNPSIHDAHSVASNHYADMTLTLNKLAQLGYRRPGLILVEQVSDTSDRDWLGSFLAHAELFPDSKTPITLTYRGWSADEIPRNWAAWLKEQKPDVIINGGGANLQWILDAGLHAPRDIGYCELALNPSAIHTAGIQQPTRKIGALAVTQLVSMLQNGERGLMKNPYSLLVHGTWTPGETLRAQMR